MHLLDNLHGASYGGHGQFGLERDMTADLKDPWAGPRLQSFHFFSDASLDGRSVGGGVGMLASGPIVAVRQRLALASPDSHTSEVVAAGNNLSLLMPVNGVLQELGIRQGMATPFYLDSATTVFVARSDTAVKKSVWLVRRALVLTEGVDQGEIEPMHVPEYNMLADPFTKYLTLNVWKRHMHYLLNLEGPLPPRATGGNRGA
jgi:hypothetical protein